jgi:hypothetical protein
VPLVISFRDVTVVGTLRSRSLYEMKLIRRFVSFVGVRWDGTADAETGASSVLSLSLSLSSTQPPGSCGPSEIWRVGVGRFGGDRDADVADDVALAVADVGDAGDIGERGERGDSASTGDMADAMEMGDTGLVWLSLARAVASEMGCDARNAVEPVLVPVPVPVAAPVRKVSGEGLRDRPDAEAGKEVTRARSAGEKDAEGERAIAAVLAPAGASISSASIGSSAVSASTASSRTAGTVCSRLDPCGWKMRDDLCDKLGAAVLRLRDATAGISISRSKIADPDEWMLPAGEAGRDERCGWCGW